MAMENPNTAGSAGAPPGGDDDSHDAGPDMSQGYTIEIKVDAQGKISVGVEPAADEASEESGSDGAQGADPAASGWDGSDSDDENYQPCANLGDALRLVKQIYSGAGEMQDSGEAEAQMQSGFGK